MCVVVRWARLSLFEMTSPVNAAEPGKREPNITEMESGGINTSEALLSIFLLLSIDPTRIDVIFIGYG